MVNQADYERQIEKLQKQVKNLQREITIKDECLRQKNLQLDAMFWVWCSGGCDKGILRWAENHLTEEIVSIAERNTKRLREWFQNFNYRRLK